MRKKLIILAIAMAMVGQTTLALEGSNGEIVMEGDFINQDLYKLTIKAEGVKNTVIGLAFDVVFQNQNLTFLKYEPGEFLEQGGDPIYLVKSNLEKGEIVFGETLTRDDEFPTGGGKIADFYFQVEDGKYAEIKDELSFSFARGVVSTFNEIRQDLDQIKWSGLKIGPEVKAEITATEPALVSFEAEGSSTIEKFGKKVKDPNYFEGMLIGVLLFLSIMTALRIAKIRREKRQT